MIDRINTMFENPRIVALGILLVSAGSLAGAYGSEFFMDLKPCILCIYQRWPYVVTISLALLILGLWRKEKPVFWLVWASGITFYIGATIALFHTGVEQGWWKFESACTLPDNFSDFGKMDLEQIKETILGTASGKCDKPAFVLMGISMAGYNFIFSLLWGTAAMYAALRLRRKSHKQA